MMFPNKRFSVSLLNKFAFLKKGFYEKVTL